MQQAAPSNRQQLLADEEQEYPDASALDDFLDADLDANNNNNYLLPDYEQEDVESRLWESDSSYLVAVSPRIFENNRIRLKLILGYRVQSLVHGLPSAAEQQQLMSYDGTMESGGMYPYGSGGSNSSFNYMPMGPRYRRRMYTRGIMGNDADSMTPEQFNQLPEYEQRRILRERYMRRQYELGAATRDASMMNAGNAANMMIGNNNVPSLSNMSYWAMRNLDQLGWKSMVGVAAVALGLYKTVQNMYR